LLLSPALPPGCDEKFRTSVDGTSDCSVNIVLSVDTQYGPIELLYSEFLSVVNAQTLGDRVVNNIYLLVRKSYRRLLFAHLLLKNYEVDGLSPLH